MEDEYSTPYSLDTDCSSSVRHLYRGREMSVERGIPPVIDPILPIRLPKETWTPADQAEQALVVPKRPR